ncbi:MAG: CAP domain-containing protein [Polyangiaceae bacterium]
MRSWILPPLLVVGLAGCGPRNTNPEPPPLDRPTGPLNTEQAERYVVDLVNRHRAAHGLDPVEWDETAAKAARRHAADMTQVGFTAHWGSDGSVPEQRYSEAGGAHLVQENAACFFDGTPRELDPNPMFDPLQLERIENAFYDEQPPNDGHRTNILKRWHNGLGVGLAKPVGVEQPCMAQEFTDNYVDLDTLPIQAARGQVIRVAGEIKAPVEFGGVGLGRIDSARPKSAAELNQTSTYAMPAPDTLYAPEGFVTPKPVKVSGAKFEIEIPLGKTPGRYMVSVWGRYPDQKDLGMISLRSITVR